jgi:cytoskeletal protein CcmA (bactofilin family)
MADKDPTPPDQTPDDLTNLESLDGQESTVQTSEADELDIEVAPEPGTEVANGSAPPAGKGPRFKQLRARLNIYLLMLGGIIFLAGAIILIAFLQNRQTVLNKNLQTQSLSKSTLEQLADSDATVGSSHSILNVQSSAVFAGQVLVRQNLEVAGNLQIGGTIALNNLTVAGASQFGQATVNKDLAVAGNTAIQGSATISKGLQVNGGGIFNGAVSAPQLTTSHLQLNGDLVLTHHISTGGSPPSRSGGAALGGGGSVSISGSDTAGSVSINTGSGPAAGCFVTVNFTSAYGTTPHVIVTPVGAAAGGLSYYINRSASNFSICDATPPPAGSSFGFDYFVID